MGRRPTAKQAEIEGTESPARNEELHALGLEIKELEKDRKEITAKEKEKRLMATGILKSLGLEKYHVDGIEIWIDEGKEKLKVHLDSDEKEE